MTINDVRKIQIPRMVGALAIEINVPNAVPTIVTTVTEANNLPLCVLDLDISYAHAWATTV